MSSNFGKLAKNTIAFQNLTGNSNASADVEYRPLNEICSRYNNKYINNSDKAKSLEQSIRENGLIEPIVIVDIDDYLSRSIATPDEEKYLLGKKKIGVKYFISSGHRRFKAYVSIALGRDVLTNEELDNFYDDFKKLYDEYLDEKEYALINGEELPEGRWFKIPSKITKLDEVNENAVYNDSNTTQRELTAFELVVNVIDEIKINGKWDEFNEKAKAKKILSMKSRQLRSAYDDLKTKGLVDNINADEIGTSIDEKRRQNLMKLGYQYYTGLDNEVNQDICDYIESVKQRKVSRTVVNYVRKAIDVLDERIINCIYDGKLTFKDAKELIPIYNEIDVDSVLIDIRNNNFDVKKLTNFKKKKTTKYSANELIELIYDIKNGSKSVDDVIKLIEQYR